MTTDVKLRTTRVYDDNARAYLDPTVRRALNEGGTSSSKTYSILQILDLVAEHAKEPLIISVVSESLPHLKKGAIRDFFNIRGEADAKGNPNWNMTDHIYTYPTSGAKVEFFGADEAGKVHGPRRQILFLNEANTIPWRAAQALDLRTTKFVFADWNPIGRFWAHEYESDGKQVPGWIERPGNAYIHSTYLDAIDVIPSEIVAKIEDMKDKDPNGWRIYGLGLLGKTVGLVYSIFTQCDELPDGGYTFFGVDWGYTIDYNALVKCVVKGDTLYMEELVFERGLDNNAFAARMVDVGVRKHHDLIWADAAEPKSIDEVAAHGFNIRGAPKGPGSVAYGEQKVRQFHLVWVKESVNCIKAMKNFRYIEDKKTGRLTDKTTHQFSHGMDAMRYAVAGYLTPVVGDAVVVYDSMEGADSMDLEL